MNQRLHSKQLQESLRVCACVCLCVPVNTSNMAVLSPQQLVLTCEQHDNLIIKYLFYTVLSNDFFYFEGPTKLLIAIVCACREKEAFVPAFALQ